MSTQIIVDLLIKIFILTIFGFGLKKIGLINDSLQKGLNQLLLKAILPVTILMSSQNDFTIKLSGNMLITLVMVVGYYVIAIFISNLLSKILNSNKNKKNVFIMMTVFANVGFIGFPIIGELYGAEGTLYAVVYNMIFQLIFFTYGVSLISGNTQFKLQMIIKNPVTIASFVCIILFLLQIRFEAGIGSALSSVGNMTTPISLILIGCSLADTHIKELFVDKYSYCVSFLRMIIYPLAALIVVKILGLPYLVAGSFVILTALPAGSLNVIYAQQHECEAEFASRTVIQTMIFMIITLPVLIILTNFIL